jgi:hypothetical protein
MTLLSLLIASTLAQAGGSISKEEAVDVICFRSKPMCSVAKTLNLAAVGSAVRDREGYRHMPYEFGATAADGNTFTVFFDWNAKTQKVTATITE